MTQEGRCGVGPVSSGRGLFFLVSDREVVMTHAERQIVQFDPSEEEHEAKDEHIAVAHVYYIA